ncbi:DUF4112 domain-containing protein [Rhizobium sp. BG4]|jgi:hypothetical protein|uniref:DUF4112 domain-containing protein n=1 Tax=Rhizobium sp. BG4 TaxID=2613770 RepID=UPI0011D0AFF8|nr:DUF4112 domain-containing protein [Rhizobium sp. BG4]QRM47781.1 DUF4112 domain-containing protein [Rhizobium sp. BG4]
MSFRRNSGPTPAEEVRIRRAMRLANLMDTAVGIPGLGIRFGADAILGLIPGIGDIAGSLVGLVIINEARQLGLPREKLVKMLVNLGLDAASGTIPIAGDFFDVYFKSHRRNARIILDHFGIDRQS